MTKVALLICHGSVHHYLPIYKTQSVIPTVTKVALLICHSSVHYYLTLPKTLLVSLTVTEVAVLICHGSVHYYLPITQNTISHSKCDSGGDYLNLLRFNTLQLTHYTKHYQPF